MIVNHLLFDIIPHIVQVQPLLEKSQFMPILANAKKALRHTRRATIVNNRVKSEVQTAIKSMTHEPSLGQWSIVSSKLDLAVKNHLIHVNKAARLKSRLANLIPTK